MQGLNSGEALRIRKGIKIKNCDAVGIENTFRYQLVSCSTPCPSGRIRYIFCFWRCTFQIQLKTRPAMVNSHKNDAKVEARCHTFRIDVRPCNARKSIRRTRRIRKISDYFGQNCPFWTAQKIGNTIEKSTLYVKDTDHMEIPCCITKKK